MTGTTSDRAPAPMLFCIDVEPDYTATQVAGAAPCEGFVVLADLLGSMRSRLADLTGYPVHFTWLVRMDPHIRATYGTATHLLDLDEARFGALLAAGDEIGVHVHPYVRDEQTGTWVDRFTDPSVIEDCLESTFDTYQQKFGSPCRSMSFGALFMNEQILDVAERRGVRYDLSGVPGEPPTSTGTPDFRAMPTFPYYPDREMFQRAGMEGSRTIREIPQTSVDSSRLRHKVARRVRGERPPYYRTHAMWRARHLTAAQYWAAAAKNLGRLQVPYFCHVLRSEALVVDRIAATVGPILHRLPVGPILHRLPDDPIVELVRFQTPAEWLG
ncbi:MAG: hypothetical protein WCK21_04050 [Actinomycetota bacterium]